MNDFILAQWRHGILGCLVAKLRPGQNHCTAAMDPYFIQVFGLEKPPKTSGGY